MSAKLMSKVLITGASGFVGQALCPVLEDAGLTIIPVFRSAVPDPGKRIRKALAGKIIDAATDWTGDLFDIDVVVHLAARVHVMGGRKSDDAARFREVNVEGTRNFAEQAARFGVKRFVYLSSIKVNGERTESKPFVADQTPQPEDSYAISKMEAETVLRDIEKETGMEVVIIRPPLVYGPGVKGNLAALARLIEKGIPLPLRSVTNRRDLVSVFNLCDLIRVCCSHPAAAGDTFLVSDGETISTADLVLYMSKGLNRKARLFSVPVWVLHIAAGLLGKVDKLEKLTGDLQINMSKTQQVLGWKPPVTVAESFRRMFAEERIVDVRP